MEQEVVKAIKIEAFDAILKVSTANDSYFKRAEAIFNIITEAGRIIRKIEAK